MQRPRVRVPGLGACLPLGPAEALKAGLPLPDTIAHLTARSLRTSVVWTDREMGFAERVDMHLLDNLRG